MEPHLNVLVVDDEQDLRESLADMVRGFGHSVDTAENGKVALTKAKLGNFDLLLLDVRMPEMDGIEVLKNIQALDPTISVMMLTAHGNLEDAVKTIKLGAFNYLEKPIREPDVQAALLKTIEARQMVHHVGFSSPKLLLDEDEEFIGESSQMRSVFGLIQRVANTATSVLIQGENGTGKELVARACHYNSYRKNKRFVAVNCGAIPENLIESELFGHEKGAFTGADTRQIGKFQYAEGGTLFLDEIGDISLAMQVKLLRVLQEKKFTPVGSNREIKCDVRIIAATNKDLEDMIEKEQFRQDLYYRLNVMPIFLPPLRERTADIPPLVEHFISNFNLTHSRGVDGALPAVKGIRPEALQSLMHYSWPGNIRELSNVIERAFVLESGDWLSLESVPEYVTKIAEGAIQIDALDYQIQKENFEKQFIINALSTYGGRINKTVERANIPKNTLLRKIKKYGITATDYSESGADLE